MRGRRLLYRAGSDSVGVLVSTVVTCLVGAVIHPAVGAGVFVVGLVVFGVLMTGRAEVPAVRLLAWARQPRDYEMAALRPVIAMLKDLDLTSPDIELLVRCSHRGIRIGAAGRRTVALSQGLIEAVAAGQISPHEATALITHAIGRIRLRQTRYDVALEFWLLPWRVLQSFCRRVGHAVGWLPLTRLAWRLRFIMGTVALVQGIVEGRAVFGLISALVVAVSYAVPWSKSRADLLAQDEADRFVAETGLGEALSRFLERGRRSPRVLQRVHRLRASRTPDKPAMLTSRHSRTSC